MINFRKIASVLTSAVMLSSTVGFAAAANYPAPFVKNGSADVAIVWGSASAASDLVAVTDITADLSSELAAQTQESGGVAVGTSSTVEGGDYVKLERSNDMFNLGENAAAFYSSLDAEELSTVLAEGQYTNNENDDYDYTQEITLDNDLALTHFVDDEFNDEEPLVGFDLTDGSIVMTYTIEFTPDAVEGGAAFVNLATTDLTMLGRDYYVVQAQNVSGMPKLTLLDTANSAIVSSGETTTVTVEENSYEVALGFIDADEVILSVDGTTTNKLEEGDVYKIGEDTYIAVKSILYDAKETGVSKAEISIGSGKIVLQNNAELQINNEDVSDIDKYNDAVVNVTFDTTSSGSESLEGITLIWSLGDDTWLAPGSDLVLPGFETIKISMADFVVPSEEVTKIENDGDSSMKLSTTVEDGDVSFNIMYTNGTYMTGIGKDSDDVLKTGFGPTLSFDMDTDNWFVASWMSGDDAESYVLKVSDVDDTDPAKNVTTIESVASGSILSKKLDIGEAEDFGRVRLTLGTASEDGNSANFTISAAGGSGSVSFNKLYTKDGLRIQLPVNATTGADGAINMVNISSGNGLATTHRISMKEEDEDGNIEDGIVFNATLGLNTDGELHVSTISEGTFSGTDSFETEDGSDNYVGFVSSPLATKVLFKTGGDQDTVEVTYHGSEAYAEVFVSEAEAMVTTDGSGVTSLGSVSISDTEAAGVNKNLIVVGGSCVNSVAAQLLGGALCGANFEAETGAGAGQFVIETFSRSGGKVATLVAGYNAGDTTNAAKYLTAETVDTTVGKKYLGTSATSATLQVE